jgi:replicative DNA helicase
MIDVVLLKTLTSRRDFQLISQILPENTLSAETSALVKLFGKYYEQYPSHDVIDWVTFVPQFQRWHPTLTAEKFQQWVGIFRTIIQKEVDDDQRRNLLTDISEIDLMTKLANMAERHNNGELPDAFGQLTMVMDEFKRRSGVKEIKYIDTPIGDLLQAEFDDTGVSFRLSCLNKSMRRLRPGDFGIIAGRPDKGKTSFLASEATHMAAELPPDRNILWLNNEGPGSRIIPRLYQAALNLTMTEMKEKHSAGLLVNEYREAVGRLDRIRVVDIHGLTNMQCEMIIEANNPGIVIYDMIDSIKGFGDAARTDLGLEKMYQWGRERSVKYDSIGIATSQISADGDGLRYPTMAMLKDSKTGKQGACDFQIMIGSINEPGFGSSRFIGIPKNKLRRPDGPASPDCEVAFDGLRSRYKDMEFTTSV